MNQQTKSAIKSLVLDLRHTLEYKFAIAYRHYRLLDDVLQVGSLSPARQPALHTLLRYNLLKPISFCYNIRHKI